MAMRTRTDKVFASGGFAPHRRRVLLGHLIPDWQPRLTEWLTTDAQRIYAMQLASGITVYDGPHMKSILELIRASLPLYPHGVRVMMKATHPDKFDMEDLRVDRLLDIKITDPTAHTHRLLVRMLAYRILLLENGSAWGQEKITLTNLTLLSLMRQSGITRQIPVDFLPEN